MKYLIYEKTTGEIWRDLDQYVTEDDGTIFGGLNGVNTLRYPKAVNPAIIEITNEAFANIASKLAKFKVVNGEVVINPDYEEEVDVATELSSIKESIAAIEDALCEIDMG